LTAPRRLAILVVMGRWIVFAVIAIASPAHADDSDRAKELFEEGQTLAKQGKWVQACALFSESNKLDNQVGTELNLADCFVHVGKLADAWKLFDQGAAKLERINKTRAQGVRKVADDLAGKLATVVVKVAQPDLVELTITIAGHDVAVKPQITERLDPGTVVVTATAPNHEPFKTTVTIPAGASVTVDVPAFTSGVARHEEPPPAVGDRKRSRVYLALGLGGAGGIAIISGIVLNVVAQNRYDAVIHSSDCLPTMPPMCYTPGLQKIADAQELADVGTGAIVVGGAAIAVGAAVWYFAPREQVTVTPVASAHGVGLSIGGSF
jgi:hypothetical protein